MNYFESELRHLFQNSDVFEQPVFSGNCLIGKLDDDLRIKVMFATQGYADHYSALSVKIINRTGGEVDSQKFVFNDILGANPVNKGINGRAQIYIWQDGGKAEWYGYRPTDAQFSQIADTVESYASMFQSDDLQMTM